MFCRHIAMDQDLDVFFFDGILRIALNKDLGLNRPYGVIYFYLSKRYLHRRPMRPYVCMAIHSSIGVFLYAKLKTIIRKIMKINMAPSPIENLVFR